MILDVTRYQEDLKSTAYRILKDHSLAEDMVQDTYLQALEYGIDEKGQLIEIVTKLSLSLWGDRKRGVDTPQSGFYKPWEGEDEDPIWRKLPTENGEVTVVVNEEITRAVSTIKDHNGKYMPFFQAREYVRTFNFTGKKAWQEYKRGNPLVNIPICPDSVYDMEWQGWRDFLGTPDFCSFTEFLNYVRTTLVPQGISNSAKWHKYMPNLPQFIPTNPHKIYKAEWKGWGHVFETTRKTWSGILPYDEAKAYVQMHFTPNGIDTLYKYKNKAALPEFLPQSPSDHYKNKGWTNTADFFGTDKPNGLNPRREFLPYKEAREWVRLNLRIYGIINYKLYREYMTGQLTGDDFPPVPSFLPKDAQGYYKDDGYSAADFLGNPKLINTSVSYFTYNESKEWIRSHLQGKVKTAADWDKYKRGRYPDLPSYPRKMCQAPYHKYKASKEWKDWDDFLGVVTVKKVKTVGKSERRTFRGKTRNFLSYEKARQYMIDFMVPAGIDTLRKYNCLENKPVNIPADPKGYYKRKGWISASYFMGGDADKGKGRKGRNYLSYSEAKAWVKKNFVPIGIDTVQKYRKNLDKLPADMPPDPLHYYKSRGWVDSYDFMGIEDGRKTRGRNVHNGFLSFGEACDWVKNNLPGVGSVKKWRSYTQGGFPHLPKLPANIPVVPDQTYHNIGAWKGWGEFLSTGENRGRHMKDKAQISLRIPF